MAVGDIYKLALLQTFTGVDDIVCTFHYREGVDPVLPNLAQDLAQGWLDEVWPVYKLLLSSRITLEAIQVRPVDPTDDFFDLTVEDNGSHGSGDICPLQDAPLITWRTSFIGRSNRGRVYLPPPLETVNDAGQLNGPYLELMEDFAVANIVIAADAGHGRWDQVIHSEVTGLNPFVVSFVTRDIMGSQRRRRQGVGS